MLVEFLEGQKLEVVRRVESHAAADEGPGAASGRHERIGALVEELIQSVRHGNGGRTPQTAVDARNAALQCRERDLVRFDVMKEVGRHSLKVTPNEMATVCDWASAADRCRLREGYDRLSDLLDDMDEGTLIVSANGRIDYVNRRLAHQVFELTGVPRGQLVGKTFAELGMGPESLCRKPDEYIPLARRRASYEQVLRGRWYETKFRAIYAPSGEVAVAFVSRDIHQRKLAQIRLELLAKLSAMVGCVDYDHVAEALAGLPIPELADWCIVNLVEDERIVRTFVAQSDPAKSALRDALVRAVPDWSRNPLWTEMRLTSGFQLLTDVSDELLRKFALNEQQYRVLLMTGVRSLMVQPVVARDRIAALITFMYTTESGRRYGQDDPALAGELALYAAQIIENARLMRDLRATEARFCVSLAGAKTLVYEQDAALRYRWGYSPIVPVNVVGKTHEDLFSAEDAALLTALKRRVLESGEGVCEELVVHLGGERHNLRQAIEPIRDQEGKVVGVIGSATDISAEKQTQEQLSQALGFRDRMIGVLGHELRNPLAAIKMAAAVMARVPDLPEELRKGTQIIEKATGRMNEMIETLLDFARVESLGKLPVSLAPTDVGAKAREVVEEARAAWPDRTIELATGGDLHGQWDPARLQQALSNLIVNALQHGEPRKPVRVSADGVGTAVLLRVRNEGTPIPSDLMPALFEPFARGPSDTSPQGLGLGLFIVKQIAIAHGGTVDVESNPEVGTLFTLLLPRAG
jgi:PAS domain S-box-containing protein